MFQKNVAKGIHRIEDAYTNWYIVEEGDRLTVVDAGIPVSWSSLDKALDEIGRGLEHIDALVLTHAHFDHTGFAEKIRSEYGVPVWVHENDVPLTKHPLQYGHERSRLPYLFNPRAVPIAAALISGRAFLPRAIAEVTRFTDGTLDVPGSPRVVFTPGHTLGHCSLAFDDRDALIAGDAIVTLDPYTGTTGPRLASRAATVDSERAYESLDAIAATGLGTVLTGHGEPWYEGAAAAADEARHAGIS